MSLKYTGIAFCGLAVFFAMTFVLPMQRLQAQDVIQLNNAQDVSMTGTITDLDDDGFVLSTGETSTNVSLEGMKTGADLSALLKNGMKVTIQGTMSAGTFNEPLIVAKTISAYQEPLQPGAPVPPTAGNPVTAPGR